MLKKVAILTMMIVAMFGQNVTAAEVSENEVN